MAHQLQNLSLVHHFNVWLIIIHIKIVLIMILLVNAVPQLSNIELCLICFEKIDTILGATAYWNKIYLLLVLIVIIMLMENNKKSH